MALSGPCCSSERILDVLSSGKSGGFRPRRLRADFPASSAEASDACDIGVEVSLADGCEFCGAVAKPRIPAINS